MTDYLDGNVLAGPLREVFGVDLTTAGTRCVGCGQAAHVAELRVFTDAPGLVARCSGCDNVIMRLVRTPDAAWLDLRGTTALRVPVG
jgi:hypothetical protein